MESSFFQILGQQKQITFYRPDHVKVILGVGFHHETITITAVTAEFSNRTRTLYLCNLSPEALREAPNESYTCSSYHVSIHSYMLF